MEPHTLIHGRLRNACFTRQWPISSLAKAKLCHGRRPSPVHRTARSGRSGTCDRHSRHQRRALRPLAFWLRPSGEASMLQGMAVIDYIWPDPKRIHKSMITRISSTSTKPWDVWRTVYLSNISKCYNLLISNPMLCLTVGDLTRLKS